MNVEDITWRLAHLSSLPYQERYVINGTIDEYVVAIDLLEDVDSLKYLTRRPEHREYLTNAQIATLEDLYKYIEENAVRALNAPSREEAAALIRESEVWIEMRAKAAAALEAFGLSADMTIEEIIRMTD